MVPVVIKVVWFISLSGSVLVDRCYETSDDKKWFCCNNHERQNDTCVACSDGFRARDRLPCEKCPVGTWGRKCSGNCNVDCQRNQRCDHVIGCIETVDITTTHVVSNEVQDIGHTSISNMAYTNSTSTTMNKGQHTTFQGATKTSTDTDEDSLMPTSYKAKNEPTNVTVKECLLDREIIVYSACGFGIIVIVVVFILCLRRNTRHYLMYRKSTRHRYNPREEGSPNQPSQGIYDEIEDENVLDSPIHPHIEIYLEVQSNSTDESENRISVGGDGYLHPSRGGTQSQDYFHPSGGGTKSHDYRQIGDSRTERSVKNILSLQNMECLLPIPSKVDTCDSSSADESIGMDRQSNSDTNSYIIPQTNMSTEDIPIYNSTPVEEAQLHKEDNVPNKCKIMDDQNTNSNESEDEFSLR